MTYTTDSLKNEPISRENFSFHAFNALTHADIETVFSACLHTKEEMLEVSRKYADLYFGYGQNVAKVDDWETKEIFLGIETTLNGIYNHRFSYTENWKLKEFGLNLDDNSFNRQPLEEALLLSNKTKNGLMKAGVKILGHLSFLDEADIVTISSLGGSAIHEINLELAMKGKSLKMVAPDHPKFPLVEEAKRGFIAAQKGQLNPHLVLNSAP